MNIFFLSYLIEEAARAHFNKHIVKMVLETCQLLSAAHWVLDPANATKLFATERLMRATHAKHPCAVWVRSHVNNYRWLSLLGLALCSEYTRRFSPSGEERRHKLEPMLRFLAANEPGGLPTDAAKLNVHGLTEPVQCMLPPYRVPGDAVAAYRAYYQGAEKQALRWWRPKAAVVGPTDDHETYAPAWFTARPLHVQKDYQARLARVQRKRSYADTLAQQ